MKQAVIIAGGKGTRLGQLTENVPKPLMKIGNKSILEHQLSVLSRYNFYEVIILTNHLADRISLHLGDGSNIGMKISYHIEKEPLGTVGGLKEIEDLLDEEFLVIYGDVVFDMDLNRLVEFHRNKKSIATLVVHPNDHPYDSDLVEIDDQQQITGFIPKPHKQGEFHRNLVNAGLYAFSKNLLNYLQKGIKADFGKDIFPTLCMQEPVFAYNTPEYLKDMGTPDRLEKVTGDWESGKIARLNLRNRRKAIFIDRDGVVNEENDMVFRPDQLNIFDFVPQSIKKINTSEYLAVLITNQSVVARNLCTLEELRQIFNKLETELGKNRSFLDAIYFCPHHPDKGFQGENTDLKIVCECRKPKPGMILQAATDLNIDLENSFMIGDAQRDIEAGKSAGVMTIGVRTGKGLKDAHTLPDYFLDDLNDAVDFILNDSFRAYYNLLEKLVDERLTYTYPAIVNIGGNSRTGKSNFARYAKINFEKRNQRCLIIHLDNWLLPVEMRTPNMNVFDRFQKEKVQEDLEKILLGETVTRPIYNPVTRKVTDEFIRYKLDNHQIVLIEGVISLSINNLENYSPIKVYCKTEQQVYEKRIFNFYRWKGFSDQEISDLIIQRSQDEFGLVSENESEADMILIS